MHSALLGTSHHGAWPARPGREQVAQLPTSSKAAVVRSGPCSQGTARAQTVVVHSARSATMAHTTWLARGGADAAPSPFHSLGLAEAGLANVGGAWGGCLMLPVGCTLQLRSSHAVLRGRDWGREAHAQAQAYACRTYADPGDVQCMWLIHDVSDLGLLCARRWAAL